MCKRNIVMSCFNEVEMSKVSNCCPVDGLLHVLNVNLPKTSPIFVI